MEANQNANRNMADDSLEEKNVPDVSFEGVKLSVESGNLLDESQAQSQPPVSPGGTVHPKAGTGFYFAAQDGRLEAAANACQNQVLTQEEDGSMLGVWLLTEIDHWDNEKERVVVVAEHSVTLVKFDFITNQLKEFRRVAFQNLTSIQLGNFMYPEKTLSQRRTGEGIRLFWGGTRQLSVFEKWNPFSNTIPYTTFASHPLKTSDLRHAQSYEVANFADTLQQAVSTCRTQRHPNLPPVTTVNADIQCEIYVGLSSTVYNQSKLGFFRERGGISF